MGTGGAVNGRQAIASSGSSDVTGVVNTPASGAGRAPGASSSSSHVASQRTAGSGVGMRGQHAGGIPSLDSEQLRASNPDDLDGYTAADESQRRAASQSLGLELAMGAGLETGASQAVGSFMESSA